MTPSAVSKLIARLEARLGARLVNRSTRKLQLTPEGTAFYDSGVRILADIAAAEREAAAGAAPRGRLRVNCNVPFGLHRLMPLMPGFLERYPEIVVDLVADRQCDRPDGGACRRRHPRRSAAAIRGWWRASSGRAGWWSLARRPISRRHGTPRSPADLDRHNCLAFGFARHVEGWPFVDAAGNAIMVPITGNTLVSDGESMRLMAVGGVGIARLARWHVAR